MILLTIIAAEAADSVDLSRELLIPVIIALVAGSIGGLVGRLNVTAERRREHYAEAVAALVAWCEYPYVIRRRTSDDPATLERIANTGHELQERIARAQTWVGTEHPKMGEAYRRLVRSVKGQVGPIIEEAWRCEPVASAEDMVLNGWGREQCSDAMEQIEQFGTSASRRFGSRRLRKRPES